MESIHIRPSTPDDDGRIVEIRNTINHDRPPMSVEYLRFYRSVRPPEAAQETIVAEREERILGLAEWSRRVYIEDKDQFWCQIYVDPTQWSQGIGGALHEWACRQLVDRGARKIRTEVREDLPQAEGFAQRRGFKKTGYGDQISRLQVNAARLERCQAAFRQVTESGIRITTLAEVGTDDTLLRSLCDLDNTTARDIPSSDEWKPMPFEEWKKHVVEGPGSSPNIFWVALDGERLVGLAPLQLRSKTIADNAYTGVHPDYRGRGIARAMKLCTVEWASKNGVEYIVTGNDVHNKPMLAINIDMGYQKLPANVEMLKEL